MARLLVVSVTIEGEGTRTPRDIAQEFLFQFKRAGYEVTKSTLEEKTLTEDQPVYYGGA
jgi:hypothetical protein